MNGLKKKFGIKLDKIDRQARKRVGAPTPTGEFWISITLALTWLVSLIMWCNLDNRKPRLLGVLFLISIILFLF